MTYLTFIPAASSYAATGELRPRQRAAQRDRQDLDADLGGGVIKQRIARKGGGKSGGFRALILLRAGERAFFVHGFAKSDRSLGRSRIAAKQTCPAYRYRATSRLYPTQPGVAAILFSAPGYGFSPMASSTA
jgi:hypothetical protein